MNRLTRNIVRMGCLSAAVLVAGACADLTGPTEAPMNPQFEDVPPPEHPPEPVAEGRMTGGGFQLRLDGAKVTRGLTLHCDITLSNNLEINWPGANNWHLEKESLTYVTCLDDPNYDPFPPEAPFDTFIAFATGSLNGVDGSLISFKFIDDGEPGDTDEAYITIWEPGQGPGQVPAGSEVVALQIGGQLDGGNLQAHYDQPHS